MKCSHSFYSDEADLRSKLRVVDQVFQWVTTTELVKQSR